MFYGMILFYIKGNKTASRVFLTSSVLETCYDAAEHEESVERKRGEADS